MAFTTPETLHLLLEKLSDNVADYCRYQARNLIILFLNKNSSDAC